MLISLKRSERCRNVKQVSKIFLPNIRFAYGCVFWPLLIVLLQSQAIRSYTSL